MFRIVKCNAKLLDTPAWLFLLVSRAINLGIDRQYKSSFIYAYVYMCVCIYVCVKTERERERQVSTDNTQHVVYSTSIGGKVIRTVVSFPKNIVSVVE